METPVIPVVVNSERVNVRKSRRPSVPTPKKAKPADAERVPTTIQFDPEASDLLSLFVLGMRTREGKKLDRSDVVNELVKAHCRRFSLRDLAVRESSPTPATQEVSAS